MCGGVRALLVTGIVLFFMHGKSNSKTGMNLLHPSQGSSPLAATPLLRFKIARFWLRGECATERPLMKFDIDRLVLVDWPHAKVISAKEVVSLAPVHESTLGVTHHWVAVNVKDAAFSQYRIWFQFRRAKRDEWLAQLAQICGKEAQRGPA